MNDITFERIHKVFLESYTLEECAYRPNQKQYIELKAKVEKILAEDCKNCTTCEGVDECTTDSPVEDRNV